MRIAKLQITQGPKTKCPCDKCKILKNISSENLSYEADEREKFHVWVDIIKKEENFLIVKVDEILLLQPGYKFGLK